MQNRLASAGHLGLRERPVQVARAAEKGEGEVGGGFLHDANLTMTLCRKRRRPVRGVNEGCHRGISMTLEAT